MRLNTKANAVPRYVILEHDHPALHWDFMLEAKGVLRTWRLAAPPEPGRSMPAELSFDHRLHYLDYEGPVSGDRGNVRRWDAGSFVYVIDTPGKMIVRLEGQHLIGTVQLEEHAPGKWDLSVEAS